MRKTLLMMAAAWTALTASADDRYNFNAGWRLHVQKNLKGAEKSDFDDAVWKQVTLPYAWNQEEAFSRAEWPALGQSVPVWMSDFSNRLVLGCNGNLFRWMHVTPLKQDVESFDRLGLLQAMPAGDSEKDIKGRRWQQRVEVMRDAIIYNRNNPSVIFYECGNNQISEEHMAEMKASKSVKLGIIEIEFNE